LVKLNFLNDEDVTNFLSRQYGVPRSLSPWSIPRMSSPWTISSS
jgi:hypothetical protein